MHHSRLSCVLLTLSSLGVACSAETPPPKGADNHADEVVTTDAISTPGEAADDPVSDSASAEDEGTWEGEADAVASGDDRQARNLSDGETRTTQVIQQTVMDNRDAVRACYDKVQAKIPTLKGDMTISFVIDPQGAVKHAELNVAKSTLKNPELTKCAIEEIKRIEFPPSSKGLESKVNYPFNLNPR